VSLSCLRWPSPTDPSARTVGFVIGFSTFLLGCVDYSRIRHDRVTLLSDVVVSRCVSKYDDHCLLEICNLTVLQILWLHFALLFTLLRFLRLADRHLRLRHPAACRHVPLLHPPSPHSRCKLAFVTFTPYPYSPSLGRYPDHILARSRPSYRRHSRGEPPHRIVLHLRCPCARRKRCDGQAGCP
jgi:hypothetical protein